MKTMLRIILEVILISILVIFVNNSFTQEKKQEIIYDLRTPDLIGVTKSEWAAKNLPGFDYFSIYKVLSQSGYVSKSKFFPSMGYDQANKRLIPITISLKSPVGKEPIPGEDLVLLLAGQRDSITTSQNDLEQRVTRLENKVAQIEKECCPKK